MIKKILILSIIFLIASCSTVRTDIYNSADLSKSPTITIKINNDLWDLEKSISSRIENIGFTINRKTNETPEYYAIVDYETFWDVVHQTFNHFEIRIVESKSQKEILKSLYVGRVGFNSCEKALDLVFKDVSKKLKAGT